MLRHLNQASQLPRRVVILGAGGFVGGTLAKRLVPMHAPMLALTRNDVDLLAAHADDDLACLLKPGDAVIAAAGRVPCRTVSALSENITMTRAIIGALAKVDIAHVVNVSSDAVYADEPVPLTEISLTAPDTLHGAMHLAREIAFRSEVRAPLATLRPSLLYGVTDPHNGYGPNKFRRLANAGETIVLFGEGEERRDHVLIDDLAEIILRVLQARSTGVLNVATGNVHSFREIAEMVVAQSPTRVAIEGSPRSAPMPHNGYRPFDIAATRAAFPDFNYTPITEGLGRVQRDSENAARWQR